MLGRSLGAYKSTEAVLRAMQGIRIPPAPSLAGTAFNFSSHEGPIYDFASTGSAAEQRAPACWRCFAGRKPREPPNSNGNDPAETPFHPMTAPEMLQLAATCRVVQRAVHLAWRPRCIRALIAASASDRLLLVQPLAGLVLGVWRSCFVGCPPPIQQHMSVTDPAVGTDCAPWP